MSINGQVLFQVVEIISLLMSHCCICELMSWKSFCGMNIIRGAKAIRTIESPSSPRLSFDVNIPAILFLAASIVSFRNCIDSGLTNLPETRGYRPHLAHAKERWKKLAISYRFMKLNHEVQGGVTSSNILWQNCLFTGHDRQPIWLYTKLKLGSPSCIPSICLNQKLPLLHFWCREKTMKEPAGERQSFCRSRIRWHTKPVRHHPPRLQSLVASTGRLTSSHSAVRPNLFVQSEWSKRWSAKRVSLAGLKKK